jgi:hypothetical protein
VDLQEEPEPQLEATAPSILAAAENPLLG